MKHVAFIMDGNRRWAYKTRDEFAADSTKSETHYASINTFQAFMTVVDTSILWHVAVISVYALSIENLQRTDDSLPLIYSMIRYKAEELIANLNARGVCMKFIGDRALFHPSITDAVANIETETAKNEGLQLNFLFCYGAQQEIVHAAKALALRVAAGELEATSINADVFEAELWLKTVPPIDLLIRTGGFTRLSNFLFYQAAYAEFVFIDVLWPELTEEILTDIFTKITTTERKFGK